MQHRTNAAVGADQYRTSAGDTRQVEAPWPKCHATCSVPLYELPALGVQAEFGSAANFLLHRQNRFRVALMV